jgi:3',5'-cyclic AMP phosphodiesterase CpdA
MNKACPMRGAHILLRCCLTTILTVFQATAISATGKLTLFAIGDTGDCATDGSEKVSAAMRAQPDWRSAWLVEVGDLAYPVATWERLTKCHEPYFGMFGKRIAVPGNHDWADHNGRGFFSLFRARLPRVVNLGGRWQIWLLDSNVSGKAADRQLLWLDDQVAKASGNCVIAAWHHPRWSSGWHGQERQGMPWWDRVAGVATFTLHGHDHHYEAVPALDAAGEPAETGTRSFVVGNSGAKLYPAITNARNAKIVSGRWGFLRVDLEDDRYSWRAIGIDGETLDAGSAECLSARPHISPAAH